MAAPQLVVIVAGGSPIERRMRIMRVGHAAFLVACLAGASQPAWAECLPISEFAKRLAAKYHEAPVARAIQGGLPIIVFASEGGQTYTIVAILQGKTACTVAAGTDWQAVASPTPDTAS
jgi:hypothetical protein